MKDEVLSSYNILKQQPDMFFKKAVLKNFAIFTIKHLSSGFQLYSKENPTHVFPCL